MGSDSIIKKKFLESVIHNSFIGYEFYIKKRVLESITHNWFMGCEFYHKNFERTISSTHFLVHFNNYVGELWTYLHCYLKNGNNVNHGQMFY